MILKKFCSVTSTEMYIKKTPHLLWVHKTVMVEILVVKREAAHSSHLWVAGLVETLTHHKHRIVHHTGGTLGHRVHANNVNNAYDTLKRRLKGEHYTTILSEIYLHQTNLVCFH